MTEGGILFEVWLLMNRNLAASRGIFFFWQHHRCGIRPGQITQYADIRQRIALSVDLVGSGKT